MAVDDRKVCPSPSDKIIIIIVNPLALPMQHNGLGIPPPTNRFHDIKGSKLIKEPKRNDPCSLLLPASFSASVNDRNAPSSALDDLNDAGIRKSIYDR